MFKESETIEFKKSTAEIKGAAVSVAAMLNKHGRGEVHFGITKIIRMTPDGQEKRYDRDIVNDSRG